MDMKFKPGFSAVAIVAFLGVVLSTAIFLEIRNSALERFSVVFQKQAKDRTGAVSGKLGHHLLEMEGIRRFYEQSDEVTGKEFKLYAEPMLQDSCVQTMEWIPRVRQDGRVAFEARTGIRIMEQDVDGQLVPAQERAEYFPIERAEPFKLNEPALGFDLGSNPERLAALEAARDQGGSRAQLVRLVESPTNPPVFMLVAPVYHRPAETLEDRRRNLNGFVLGMYRMDGLVMHSMEKVSAQGLAFMLEDLDAAPGNRLLYRHDPQIGTFDWDRAPDVLWKHEELIDGAGRNWRMTVFPNDVFIRTYLSGVYWWILPVGLLLTLLVAMLVRMQLHGRIKAELLVHWRTAALRESEEHLRAIYGAADNVALIITDLGGANSRILSFSPGAEKIFGYAAEEVLGQKVAIFHLPEMVAEFSAMHQTLREGRKGHEGEATLVRKSGECFPSLLTIHPLFNADGELVGTMGVSIDITERRKAEEAQLGSEERFRGMFENMSTGVAIYQAVDGGTDFVFVDFNPAAERIEKVARKDMLGRRLTEAFPQAEAIGIFEVLQRVWRTGEPERFPVCFYKDERIEGWRENYIYRLPSGEVVAVCDDLTAQKQAEQERAHAHAFLQTVIDGFPGALMVINLDYTVALGNRAAHEIGETISPGSFSKKCHFIFHGSLTPCDSNHHPCPMEEVLKTKGIVTLEHILSDAKGNKTPVEVVAAPIFDESGEVVQIIETLRDITVRKKAEEEKERLMAAIDQVAETIVITDADGTIEYVNPAFERITGYTYEEAIGQNPRILKNGEQDDAFYRAMWRMLTAGETWNGRFSNRKKDGTFYTEEATISPVKDSEGKIVNYVAIKSDITAELVREEQVRQVQKMESVGRLAGGVAHDFNNILQTITGFSGLILAEMDAQSAQRKDVVEIQKAARLAGELTQQLLAFSREQPVQHAVIALNTVLSDGKKMLRQALDDSFKLHFKPEPPLKLVRGDASQILQIAMNLVVNARDAMPDGGTITLRTQNIGVTEADLSGWPGSKVGEWVCFSVSDTGCGMDEKQLAHLFEPFYTTKRLGEGTGLGLSVVYGIVNDHGGWISVSSESGKGTVFQVCLPAHDAAESNEGVGLTDPDAFRGKRILLVEDDPVIRELTAEILQDIGYAVTVAGDAGEAGQLFSEKSGAFDMLFSDVVLPDGNGIELAGFFQEQQLGLPVLLFSGYPDERARVDLIHEKGFNYIRKPFNLKKLLDTVDRTITGFQG